MTDAQFERIKKSLNFHSEGGVYNLCTLTETTLREIIEDAVKFYEKQQKIDALHILELHKQKGELTDKVKELEQKLIEADNATDVFNAQEKRIAELTDELKALRESMKDYGAGCYENGLRNGRRATEKDIERQGELLEKATELLRKWVELYKPKLEGYPITPIQEQTEQFFSEVEK
jgi:flagellar biosynthesis/type III secretory pathway chaperone